MRGINPKAWFYGFKQHLDARSDISRVALATAAGEQWLNGELVGWLSTKLPPHLTVISERAKRDLSICRVVEGKTDWELVATLELKLVYCSYPTAKVEAYAERLIAQMRANRAQRVPSYGWFGTVFNDWDGRGLKHCSTFGEERKRTGKALRGIAKQAGIQLARDSMETILEEKTVQVGGLEWTVGLAAQYLEAT